MASSGALVLAWLLAGCGGGGVDGYSFLGTADGTRVYAKRLDRGSLLAVAIVNGKGDIICEATGPVAMPAQSFCSDYASGTYVFAMPVAAGKHPLLCDEDSGRHVSYAALPGPEGSGVDLAVKIVSGVEDVLRLTRCRFLRGN